MRWHRARPRAVVCRRDTCARKAVFSIRCRLIITIAMVLMTSSPAIKAQSTAVVWRLLCKNFLLPVGPNPISVRPYSEDHITKLLLIRKPAIRHRGNFLHHRFLGLQVLHVAAAQ